MRIYAVMSNNDDDNVALCEIDYPRPVRIYAAQSGSPTDDNVILCDLAYPWVLVSFKGTRDPRMSLACRPTLLLDSGAFSVWTQGMTVDRDELVAWAKEITAYYAPGEVRLINLDVIPGTPNRPPSAAERLWAASASAENAQAIRAAGVPVIEVYHRYEPLSVFEAILERRQPGELVAIGGLVGRAGGTRGKMEFCDSAFGFLRDWCGGWDKLVPVHGLGVSGDAPMARRYPWYSVDSSTWFTMRNFNLHVRADGRFQPRNRETAPRTTKAMVNLFTRRRLVLWRRSADQLSRGWEARGVRFIDV